MKLFYAHYSSLEDAFVQHVQTERRTPLSPWLVVCASTFMSARLKERLARQFGAAANIHFLTMGALVSTLDAQAAGEHLPLLPQDNLRDFLIKNLLEEPVLNRYPVSRGFVQAVKSSLRDLEDSLADPDTLDEHLRTLPDAALEQDGARWQWLTRLYRRYLQAQREVPGYRPYQAAFENALSQVDAPDSFLRGFDQIVFYGFYDMPGRPLELVNRVQSSFETAVFAPYQKHPAYRFAQKFFETNWLGRAQETVEFPGEYGALGESGRYLFSSEGSAAAPSVTVVSASDAGGEVFYTAKEILRLVEKEGYAFSDIAVIARTTAPYQEEIRRVFKANCIALNASFSYPLVHYPLGVFCQNLFSLAANGFDRSTVLSVVSSPYFKPAEKFRWRTLAASSLVTRDLNQWKDLLPQTKNFDPAFLAWLEQTQTDLAALAAPQPWEKLATLAQMFLAKNTDETAFEGKDAEIYQTVLEKLAGLSAYQAVRPTVQAEEGVREIGDVLTGLSFNEAEAVPSGVVFTDAVRARGLRARAVFVLGLNDKAFPLVTPEDPVLRDYYRYTLREVLGYWLNQSLERGDEEKLLFFAAVTAGTEKLYALYARADEEGKAAVPSVYLAELSRACGLNLQAADAPRVSGRLSERLASVSAEFLTPKELSLAFILNPDQASQHYQAAGLLTPQLKRVLEAAHTLRQTGAPTAFDGFVQSGPTIFARENESGFSPSALQTLAQCPLKYFFDKGVKLADTEDPLSRQELSPDRRGTLYHEILKDFYSELYQDKCTHDLFDSATLERLEHVWRAHCRLEDYRLFGLYPVVWDLIMQDIYAKLSAFVLEDLHELGSFTPARFEMPVTAPATDEIPFKLRGIIDRVDLDEASKTFRVADYKSSRKGTQNLASDLFKHLLFQPFLYVWIAAHLPEFKSYQSAGSCLLSINKGYERREMTASAFEDIRPRACEFFNLLAKLIEEGTFFLCPSDLCQYCPYATICRRDSFKSLLRARKCTAAQQLEEARQ